MDSQNSSRIVNGFLASFNFTVGMTGGCDDSFADVGVNTRRHQCDRCSGRRAFCRCIHKGRYHSCRYAGDRSRSYGSQRRRSSGRCWCPVDAGASAVIFVVAASVAEASTDRCRGAGQTRLRCRGAVKQFRKEFDWSNSSNDCCHRCNDQLCIAGVNWKESRSIVISLYVLKHPVLDFNPLDQAA